MPKPHPLFVALVLLSVYLLPVNPALAAKQTGKGRIAAQIAIGMTLGAVTYFAMQGLGHPSGYDRSHDAFVWRSAGSASFVGAQFVYLLGEKKHRPTWAWTTVSGLLPLGLTYLGVKADRACRRQEDDDCGLAGDLAGMASTLLAPTTALIGYSLVREPLDNRTALAIVKPKGVKLPSATRPGSLWDQPINRRLLRPYMGPTPLTVSSISTQ